MGLVKWVLTQKALFLEQALGLKPPIPLPNKNGRINLTRLPVGKFKKPQKLG